MMATSDAIEADTKEQFRIRRTFLGTGGNSPLTQELQAES